jgi:hypothetical protein
MRSPQKRGSLGATCHLGGSLRHELLTRRWLILYSIASLPVWLALYLVLQAWTWRGARYAILALTPIAAILAWKFIYENRRYREIKEAERVVGLVHGMLVELDALGVDYSREQENLGALCQLYQRHTGKVAPMLLVGQSPSA